MDFEGIYKQYFQEINLYIKSLSRDEKISEEITQEVFFKALKGINQFDGKKDIRAWLFTIAKNTYFSHYKKSKRNIVSDVIAESSSGVFVVQNLMNEEQAFKVHQLIHSMEEPYKEVFSLRVFGELSFEKIGQLFGKSDSWARVTFFRARKKIIKHMEGMEHEES